MILVLLKIVSVVSFLLLTAVVDIDALVVVDVDIVIKQYTLVGHSKIAYSRSELHAGKSPWEYKSHCRFCLILRCLSIMKVALRRIYSVKFSF